ncbi:MAG: hypothetical protein AAF399_03995 [Bacteroidota bacterium]
MKRILSFAFLSWIPVCLFSQIEFEKGYFLDNEGTKTECLIRNEGWNSNPSEFEFRLTADGKADNRNVSEVSEFGIYGGIRFISRKVEIDQGRDATNQLDFNRNPEFMEEHLFLRVLLEGEVSLYHFKGRGRSKYFFKVGASEVVQLFYKKFKISEVHIGDNKAFRDQLRDEMSCGDTLTEQIDQIEYLESQLLAYFRAYHGCRGAEYTLYEKPKQKFLYSLTFRGGWEHTGFFITGANPGLNEFTLANESGVRFGVELEMIFPTGGNRWAFTIEPTIQHFSGNMLISSGRASVMYRALELPLGLRRYWYLDDKSKIFFDGYFVFAFPTRAAIVEFPNELNLPLNSSRFNTLATGVNFGGGIGYKFGEHLVLEVRRQMRREVLREPFRIINGFLTANTSVIVGYSLPLGKR